MPDNWNFVVANGKVTFYFLPGGDTAFYFLHMDVRMYNVLPDFLGQARDQHSVDRTARIHYCYVWKGGTFNSKGSSDAQRSLHVGRGWICDAECGEYTDCFSAEK